MVTINARKAKRLIFVVAFAFLMELFVFNLDYLVYSMDNGIEKNIVYTADKLDFYGFEKSGNGWITSTDPNIVLMSVNSDVKNIQIVASTNPKVNEGTVFYTNEKYPILCAEAMFKTDRAFDENNIIKIGDYVKDLRIDVGEKEGVTLTDVVVRLNVSPFDFSFSRIVAIIMMYFCAVFLFSLQKNRDYKLN